MYFLDQQYYAYFLNSKFQALGNYINLSIDILKRY